MKKYYLLLGLFLLSIVNGFAEPSTTGATLLIVPAEKGALRVAFDVGRTYPTILVCYKAMPNGGCALQGWTGSSWTPVSAKSFEMGEFFQQPPASALLVYGKNSDLPVVLVPPESWCSSVSAVSTTDTRTLLHLIGRHYGFDYEEWKMFSDRYGIAMDRLNPDGYNLSWYHHSLKENMEQRKASAADDLQYLTTIRVPAPEPEPVVVEENSAADKDHSVEAEIPADEVTVEVPVEEEADSSEETVVPPANPLLKEAPVAVVFEAEQANEDTSAKEIGDSNDE